MALSLPDPWIGGPLADELSEDPKVLRRQLMELRDSIQRNIEALAKAYPVGASDLHLRGAEFRHSGMNQALTTTPTAVGDIEITVPLSGAYITIAVFDFNVTGSGVGECVGRVAKNGSGTALEAIYGPATTGRATVSTVTQLATLAKGDVLSLVASKSINAGTAEIENATLVTLGPVGPPIS